MIDREELHRQVDKIPEEKLPRLSDLFRQLFDEDAKYIKRLDKPNRICLMAALRISRKPF